MRSELTRKKKFDAEQLANQPPGTLSLLDLTAYGVAAVVGSGIFATVGRVARTDSGLCAPVSVLIAGFLSLATAICYLEFASALPVSGSGYAYVYGMVGEIWGWLVGWNLTLEYAFAAAAIACAWSDGLRVLVQSEFVKTYARIPEFLFVLSLPVGNFKVYPTAALMVVLVGLLVGRGVKMGARLTNVISLLNVSLIIMIIVVGAIFVQPANWSTEPYVVAEKGWWGVVEGGSHMFFAYIGYDTVSTLSTDAIKPSRDVPIAVFATLAIATLLYIGVVIVLTGMQRWDQLSADSSLVRAFQSVKGAQWAAPVVSLGSLTTMGATVMACLIGQPKIFLVMAEDGLLPDVVAGTYHRALMSTVLLTAGLAFFVDFNDPLNGINDAISFGVLLGMSAICLALLVVRLQRANIPEGTLLVRGSLAPVLYFVACVVFSMLIVLTEVSRVGVVVLSVIVIVPFINMVITFSSFNPPSLSPAFTCPLMPILPAVAILANLLVMMTTFFTAIVPFMLWTGLGLLIYFFYGRHNSLLAGKYDY